MLDDPLILRVVVVVGFLGVALAVAFVARRGIAFVRHPFRAQGLAAGVTLFTSETCDACRRARVSLTELEAEFVELSYEAHPGEFDRLGITGVPSIVILDHEGQGWIVRGHPSRSRLRRWLSDNPGGP